VKKLQLLTILLLTTALSASALAEEETRTLKDRIRSVSNLLYSKSGRMELTVYPATSMSINDAFYQKFGIGLGLGYHINNAFALQVMGTYSLNMESGYAAYHGSNPDTDVPYAGKRNILIGADFCWAPVYGKVSLAAEWILHFDTYLMGGIGGIGGDQVEDSSFGIAGTFGLGVRLFFNRTFALKLEIKDYVLFNDKVSWGTPPNETVKEGDVQHQLLFNLGLSIFFLEGRAED
jgi:outer membrane beta-barrel protein